MTKRKGIVLANRHNFKGPMAHSLAASGYDLLDFNDNLKNYDYLVVFYNKAFPKLNTRAKIGWWMNDLRYPWQVLNVDNKNFDFIFLCNGLIEEYQTFFKRKTYYMPQCGIDTPEIFSVNPREINWDLVFIGNIEHETYHSFRKPVIEELSKYFKLALINNEKTTNDQVIIYKESPISLSMTLPVKLCTSNRAYNIISSGGLCMIKKFPEIERLFTNHKHVVWWENIYDLTNHINYYLKHPKKVAQIKQNALKLYHEKHTARARLDNMFDIMEGKEDKFRGFL